MLNILNAPKKQKVVKTYQIDKSISKRLFDDSDNNNNNNQMEDCIVNQTYKDNNNCLIKLEK